MRSWIFFIPILLWYCHSPVFCSEVQSLSPKVISSNSGKIGHERFFGVKDLDYGFVFPTIKTFKKSPGGISLPNYVSVVARLRATEDETKIVDEKIQMFFSIAVLAGGVAFAIVKRKSAEETHTWKTMMWNWFVFVFIASWAGAIPAILFHEIQGNDIKPNTFIFDNANGFAVKVYLDNKFMVRVPANSFLIENSRDYSGKRILAIIKDPFKGPEKKLEEFEIDFWPNPDVAYFFNVSKRNSYEVGPAKYDELF